VERAHAERCLPETMAFLTERKAAKADLIAVGTGPGSYTGIRVGVSLALGLARGWKAVAIGIPSLEVIAAMQDGLVAVTLDARKGKFYSAAYRVSDGRILETVVEPDKRSLEEFEALVPNDTIWVRDAEPSGIALARLGLERVERGETGLQISYL
jgi:tRNA threonylcarbamoyladenosine biosynthesis protein TsaB